MRAVFLDDEQNELTRQISIKIEMHHLESQLPLCIQTSRLLVFLRRIFSYSKVYPIGYSRLTILFLILSGALAMQEKRIAIFDIFRGLATMAVVVFHATIYNFANTETFDLANSSPLVMIISFMALWGGVFILLSMIVNAMMLMRRIEQEFDAKYFWHLFLSGILYLGVHYMTIIFLGRWSNDFVSQNPNMTMVASSLRNMTVKFPSPRKFFDSSSISTIALNLLSISWILFLLFRKGGSEKVVRNGWALGILGTLSISLSILRIPLYTYFEQASLGAYHLPSTLLGFTLAHPYPFVAYFAYGLFGAMLGIFLHYEDHIKIKQLALPFGLLFIIVGLPGMLSFKFSVAQADYFWYFKTIFELGFFILLIIALGTIRWNSRLLKNLTLFSWFSRVSLSVFLLETSVSELMRQIWLVLSPNWVKSIPACVLFGLVNLMLWILVISFWQKSGFKYSFEYFWVKGMRWMGKDSTKLDAIRNVDEINQ